VEDDTSWTPEKINEAMHAEKNGTHSKTKFLFISYFTAWQGPEGILYFMLFIKDEARLRYCLTPNN
jgi:hypothetical protein